MGFGVFTLIIMITAILIFKKDDKIAVLFPTTALISCLIVDRIIENNKNLIEIVLLSL